jgi:acyl-CoA reductase-like NAD-dependent aldehyde dehydrogenase
MAEWHEKSYVPLMKELIPLYTAEQGRPLSMAELEFGIVEGFWNLDAYPEPKDEVISDDGTNKHILRMYPIGVSAALVPWNYPLILTLWKVLPALLTGCTVIVKPSPFTPLMTLKYMLEAQKHLPPGVLNVVVGNDGLGPMLTEHPNIDHVSCASSFCAPRTLI